MSSILSDIIGFLKNFSHIDILLYIAILVLIILVVSLIYIIKTSDEEESTLSSNIDLNNVIKEIENKDPIRVDLTNYENEQEEKAIISYDELLKRSREGNIYYNDEKKIDDEVSIRKISLDNNITSNDIDNVKYQKEEEFLAYLKELSKNL